MTSMSALPIELRLDIFKYLHPHDVFRLQILSKQYQTDLKEIPKHLCMENLLIFTAGYFNNWCLNVQCFFNLKWEKLPLVYMVAIINAFGFAIFEEHSRTTSLREKVEDALINSILCKAATHKSTSKRTVSFSEFSHALKWATKGENALLVKTLLAHAQPFRYEKLLLLAAKSGNESTFTYLSNNPYHPIELTCQNGQVLLTAIKYGNYQIAFKILADVRFQRFITMRIRDGGGGGGGGGETFRDRALTKSRNKYASVLENFQYFGRVLHSEVERELKDLCEIILQIESY
ncbi:hypothetical protein BDR26DRAFT_854551 [Obelidium mucronatum]|nr:hypothetical protein BDR26DRAFT_854551 [Obelidium mucronatum]